MKNLEEKSKVYEEKIQKARNDFINIGLALHFVGETVGPLTTMIGGWFIPSMKYHELSIDPKYFFGGIGFYVLLNGAAFVMKGISLTKEDNEGLYEKWKEGHLLDRGLAKFHKHYSEREEKNVKILEKYSQLFRRD